MVIFVVEGMFCDVWEIAGMIFDVELVDDVEIVPEIISEESGAVLAINYY